MKKIGILGVVGLGLVLLAGCGAAPGADKAASDKVASDKTKFSCGLPIEENILSIIGNAMKEATIPFIGATPGLA